MEGNNSTGLYSGISTTTGVNSGYGDADVVSLLNLGTRGGNTVNNGIFAGGLSSNSVNTLNLNVNGSSTLGSIQNVHINGGGQGQVLTTDGNGNLSFTTVSGSPTGPAGGSIYPNPSIAIWKSLVLS